MFKRLADLLADNYMSCSFKEHTGLECTGCGMQRSIVALLNGDIAASVHYYPAMLPLLAMFGYLLLHLFFKFQHGAKALLVMFITNAFIITINYFLKLSPLFFH